MSEINVSVAFGSEFQGTLTSANESTIEIGSNNIKPYDMMLGALASCFHHTFLEVMTKKRQTFSNIEYRVYGRKRETVPTTLEYVKMDVTVTGAQDPVQAEKSIELAKKYCSVYQTISHVATIEVDVKYE